MRNAAHPQTPTHPTHRSVPPSPNQSLVFVVFFAITKTKVPFPPSGTAAALVRKL